MASTPPPLPSSSDDSDFDDDDFGCFKSSAPVKAASNVLQDVQAQDKISSGEESINDVNQVSETDLSLNVETPDRSDDACVDHTEDQQPSTELFASHQFEDEIQSELESQNPINTNEVASAEEHGDTSSNVSETSQNSLEDKDVDIDQVVEKSYSSENKDKVVEHSVVEETKGNTEEHEVTISVTDVVNDRCDDNGDECNAVQINSSNDSQEIPVLPCDSKDEDEFGDWSDMQAFQSENKDSDKIVESESNETQNESLNDTKIDIKNDNSESKNEAVNEESPNCNSNTPELCSSSHDDNHNIPHESNKISEDAIHNQHSSPADNENNFDVDEVDDDFCDFADFSSHQEIDNGNIKQDNLPPLSFRSPPPGNTGGKNESNGDVESENTDSQDLPDKADPNMENVDSNEAWDGDDDDWGFKSAETNGQDNGSDDFGNFGSANNGEEGDWASFNETPAPAVASDDIDDDFNDFDDSDFQTPSFPQNNSVSSNIPENASKLEKAVFLCFPSALSQPHQPVTSQNEEDCDNENKTSANGIELDTLCSVIEMGLKVTPHAKEETWTIVKELRNKDPVVGTWGRLKDVNSSHALDYGWNSSHCCQEVFSTLHIDTKNVLFSQKKQSVPFYTSGLGILEPIRGGPNPSEKNQPPVSSTPTLLDTSKPEETKKVLDIPPVDFDWGSSGLTNPLKVFKNESFNNGMSSLEPFSDMLHNNIEPTKELSDEAKSILSKIPNLNFMRSNVLMFPIKD